MGNQNRKATKKEMDRIRRVIREAYPEWPNGSLSHDGRRCLPAREHARHRGLVGSYADHLGQIHDVERHRVATASHTSRLRAQRVVAPCVVGNKAQRSQARSS